MLASELADQGNADEALSLARDCWITATRTARSGWRSVRWISACGAGRMPRRPSTKPAP